MAVEQASSIPFTFWSALIAAVFGLISGAVASLIAPWVHYFIEHRRRAIEYKIERIAEVRKLLDSSESMIDVKKSSLWGFIDAHLNEQERKGAMPIRAMVVQADDGAEISQEDIKKQAISRMLSRLEKEWGLTKNT
jgi:hypothetical protein